MALSKTGRFLSKAEILGVGGLFPPFKCLAARDAEMTIKMLFERSSQKGGVGGRFEKRVNGDPT